MSMAPNQPINYCVRGALAALRGNVSSAIRDFDQSIKLDPKFIFAYYLKGRTYIYNGQYQNAERVCFDALAINPDYVLAYVGLSYIYQQRGDMATAQKYYNYAQYLLSKVNSF